MAGVADANVFSVGSVCGSGKYRLPLRGQKSGTDALGENLEERNGVLNVFEVGGNFSQLQKCRHRRQALAYFLKTFLDKPLVLGLLYNK